MFDTEELLELCRKAAGGDASLGTDDELFDAAVALESARGLLESAQAHVMDRLHQTAATDREFGHRVGPWLADAATAPRGACRGRARTAEKLVGWFAEFDEAVCDERVGWAHAELLCKVACVRNREGLAEAQEHLIVLAGQFSFEQWASLVRQLAAELDEDGGYDPNEDLHANRLRLSPNGDRTVELKGRLVGSARVTVAQTLQAVADELFRRFSADRKLDPELDMPTPATLMALALEEVCRRAGAVDLASSQAPRTEAVVVVEEGADGAELRAPDGALLPHSVAALLADAFIRPLVTDSAGLPLRYGRSRRLASPAQRTALTVRDGGCTFPGCDMPPGWCEVHHQPGWEANGQTDTDTMALLCRHHHGVTHRAGWRIEPDPQREQRWVWTTPGGRRLHSQHRRSG